MTDLSLPSLRAAANMVHAQVPPTPQYAWPLLAARTGCDVWIKHENHTPTGAFKVRGAIPYIHWLRRTHPDVTGVITATRGNHGQAQVRAARAAGLSITIVVPHGNALEKNAAMRGLGATLIEHGHDFDSAKAEALRLSEEQGLYMVPAYHGELVRGVASYGLELFDAVPDIDTGRKLADDTKRKLIDVMMYLILDLPVKNISLNLSKKLNRNLLQIIPMLKRN